MKNFEGSTRPTWKSKNLFPIQRVGTKSSSGRSRNYFSCQKIQFPSSLKQPCSFAHCSSFHVLTFFFILLLRNFNVSQQIFILCIILKHNLKISYPQSTASKSYVFYEVKQINNFFSSLYRLSDVSASLVCRNFRHPLDMFRLPYIFERYFA